jgi:hypothetical protein
VEDIFDDYPTAYGFEHIEKQGKRQRYLYRPGVTDESPLLICHADTVLASRAYQYNAKTSVVTCAELDDRLGIAVLLAIIESVGLDCLHLSDCAMLITDNEEIGQSTSALFAADCIQNPERFGRPNWLLNFDRRGTDSVCYGYENDTLSSLLRHCGHTIGQGTCSDISRMENLGVSGVNIGIGYQNEHSLKCSVYLRDTLQSILRAECFCSQFGHIRFEFVPPKKHVYAQYNSVVAKPFYKPIKQAQNPYQWTNDLVCDDCQNVSSDCTTLGGFTLCNDCCGLFYT